MKTLSQIQNNHLEFKKKLEIIHSKIIPLDFERRRRGWIKACQHDFRLFVYRFCLHLFWGPAGFLHDDVFEIAGEISKYSDLNGHRSFSKHENFIAPRGNAKSTLLSICFPAWQVLYKREKLILLVTNNSDKAKENLKNISRLLRRVGIQETYEPFITKDNTDEILVNGCKIMSRSINQDVRGLNEEGTRITLCIGDDIESEEMGNSPTMRDRNYRTWTDAIEPAGTTPTFPIQTVFLLVNTALHPECLVMKLKENSRYNTRIYPAVLHEPDEGALWNQFDSIILNTAAEFDSQKRVENAKKFYLNNKELMDEGLIINWEAGEPYWSLRIFRLQKGLATFNREKQGNPINPSKLKFSSYLIDGEQKRKDILFKVIANKIHWLGHEIDLFNLNRIAYFDGAEGKDYEKGCYASLTILGHQKTESERRSNNSPLGVVTGLDFVLDNLLMRDPPEIQAERILLKCQQWGVKYLGIEASTFQGMYASILKFKREELIKRGLLDPNYKLIIYPVTPIAQKSGTNKLTSIDNILTSLGLAPNTLKFNEQLNGEFWNQLIQFPTARFVDGPDSLAGALDFYYLFNFFKQSEKFDKQLEKF